MADLTGFDANQVEPTSEFEAIPEGQYTAVITASEFKDTKSGTGEYLELKFEIIEGDHKGRLLWSRLNLDNPNPTAVKIARSELSAICRAVGVMAPKDSSDLHNRPLLVKVRCKKRDDTGGITNEIKSYAAQKQTAATTDASTDTAPWSRS